jgi:hypothetical protein
MGFSMWLALTLYAMALLFITMTGVIWALRKRELSWRVIVGGLVFIFSDVLVAVKAFNDVEFPFRHAIVIGTYLIAEWFLVSTMTRWIQKEK